MTLPYAFPVWELPASWVQSTLAHLQEGKSWSHHGPAQTIALPCEPLIKPLYPALHTLQTKSTSHSLNIMNIFVDSDKM